MGQAAWDKLDDEAARLLLNWLIEKKDDDDDDDMKSQVVDRSVSFLMTLMDFERRNANGQTLQEDLRNYAPFGLERPNLPW